LVVARGDGGGDFSLPPPFIFFGQRFCCNLCAPRRVLLAAGGCLLEMQLMKIKIQSVKWGAALAALVLAAGLQAANPPAGEIDFGKFSPEGSSEFVEVNINNNLISMVTRLAGKDEPEVAEILKGLKSIRVNVIGLNDKNREDMTERIKAVRSQLDGSGWERVVTVLKDENDVGVYMKLRGDQAVEGVVVTVLDGKKNAVFVNIVGDIQPDKLAVVGERFDIEPLKHLPARDSEGRSKK